MTIMSSFRLNTYFNGSFQLSVSILTNILAIFLQRLLKIRIIPSPVKHKQTKTTQQQIQGHLKKLDVSRFQTKQQKSSTLSLWINIVKMRPAPQRGYSEFRPHRFAQNVNGFAHNEFHPEREWFRPEVKRLQSNSKNVNLNVRMHRMKVLKRTRYHFHCWNVHER